MNSKITWLSNGRGRLMGFRWEKWRGLVPVFIVELVGWWVEITDARTGVTLYDDFTSVCDAVQFLEAGA